MSFDTDPREEHDAEMYAAFAAKEKRIAELELQLAAQPTPEPFDDWPDYHEQAMGCGLEDRGCTDRYEAMRYGWDQAIESVAQRIEGFSPPAQPTPSGIAIVRAALEAAAKLIEDTWFHEDKTYKPVTAACARHIREMSEQAILDTVNAEQNKEPK